MALENWERLVFSAVGLILIGYALRLIYIDQITNAGIVFGLGFLSFIYANVARFKRFKGFGFEAELWEDKQKEAADLIERLREVVSIYTREVVLGKVKAGRLGKSPNWGEAWKLYNDLVTQHNALGQNIDFSALKKVMDDYFLFDLSMPEIQKIGAALLKGKEVAMQKIHDEFGPLIRDTAGYNKRFAQYSSISTKIDNSFEISAKSDLAAHALGVWQDAKERLKRDFDVDAEIDPQVLERLEKISKLYQSRPVKITPELVAWADGENN
jgi:hypothetical protein